MSTRKSCVLGAAALNKSCVEATVPQLDRPLVVSTCTDKADWLNCFPSPFGVFGTCLSQLCRARCHLDTDCPALSKDDQKNQLAKCQRDPGDYLGVCTVKVTP